MAESSRSLVYRLKADITHYAAGMRAAKGIMADYANEATKADRQSEKFRKGADQLGRTAGKIGFIAAAGLGAAVTVAARFDAAMSKVQAATHESAKNMQELRDAAIKAGADTVFSASEAAGGIEELAKAGVATKDILAGGLQGALDLAAAGGQSVADAAETAATAMVQFGRKGKDVPHIADLLAAAAGKAQGEVSDMAMALKQSGTVAAQMGVSLEETTGTLAELASSGLLGSDAGTSLRTFLLRLVPASEAAGKAMKKAGFSAFDAQGDMKSLTEIVANLQGSFSDMTVQQRTGAFTKIFGQDAIRAANILYNQGAQGLDGWINKVNDSGYAAETASIKMDNLKGDLEQFRGSLETALIGTGEGAQGPLRGLVQTLTNITNAYSELPGSAKGAVTGMLAATSLLGGGAFLGAKVIGGIANTRTALKDLGVQASTTRGLLAGLGKGLSFGATVVAIGAIGNEIEKVFDRDLNDSNLSRSLKALNGGIVSGTLADVFGDDLKGLNADLDSLDNNLGRVLHFSWGKIIPGNFGDDIGHASDNFAKLDETLAAMVESGQVELAREVFQTLADKAKEGGNSVAELKAQLRQYGIAIRNFESDQPQPRDPNLNRTLLGPLARGPRDLREDSPYRSSIRKTTRATEDDTRANKDNAKSIKSQIQAMKDARDQRLAALNAQVAYQQALDDANKTIKENGERTADGGKTLDLTTEKGRANALALNDVAAGWNDLSKRMKNAPGAFKAARENFEDLARKAGLSKEAAHKLAGEILDLPSKRIEIKADTEPARKKVTALQRLIDSLHDKNIKITATYDRVGFNVHADGHLGGTLLKASGGYISGPGSGTSDSIPAWLSNGEFVINAAATARHRQLLEQINANRYASGGYVGSQSVNFPSSLSLSRNDIAVLAQAVAQVRPMYGDVYVTGDRSFEREQARARRESSGGVTF